MQCSTKAVDAVKSWESCLEGDQILVDVSKANGIKVYFQGSGTVLGRLEIMQDKKQGKVEDVQQRLMKIDV